LKTILDDKAPGPDGIPNKVLKIAIKANTKEYVDMYNACLTEGVFPSRWKTQWLVLIPKGEKPAEKPSSYRPLCMLDTVSKLLERIIHHHAFPSRKKECRHAHGNLEAKHQKLF